MGCITGNGMPVISLLIYMGTENWLLNYLFPYPKPCAMGLSVGSLVMIIILAYSHPALSY